MSSNNGQKSRAVYLYCCIIAVSLFAGLGISHTYNLIIHGCEGLCGHTSRNMTMTAIIAQTFEMDETNVTINQDFNQYPDFTMNEMWRRRFLQYRFTRIYISDKCKFIYFTTLKTGSKTTRSTISKPRCGFRRGFWNNKNAWYTCAAQDCTPEDIAKMNSTDFLKIVFVRNPIDRFESVYNYLSKASVPKSYSLSHPISINGSLDSVQPNKTKSDSEELAFRHFVRYFYHWVQGEVEELSDYHRNVQKHLHPITSYICLPFEGEIKCFHPDFVGHTETMQMDIERLMSKLPRLAQTWHGTVQHTNAAQKERISKGTIFKYPEELLMICELYWNDFQCGHYEHVIPEICQDANEREWNLPNYCIDLNNDEMRSLNPWEIVHEYSTISDQPHTIETKSVPEKRNSYLGKISKQIMERNKKKKETITPSRSSNSSL